MSTEQAWAFLANNDLGEGDAPAALIFDCDGTLLNSLPVYERAWQATWGELGYTMTHSWYYPRSGFSEDNLISAFEEEIGKKVDHSLISASVRKYYLANIQHVVEIKPIADIARNAYGLLPMAVASCAPRALLVEGLQMVGLFDLFNAVLSVEDIGVPKPAPDIFLVAAEKLGVAAEKCLVFEDSVTGIEAAKSANMPVIDVSPLILEERKAS
ncbi:MAG: HAD family phosphatase [Zymomonas mobilis subsp. pomaceae]|uniref:HAD-superfamily hydrolase, subfamily IA, variant 3 n=1 Tax=Zymomonas mobilis subsp. pomaceae (strain ATCC 29192 / DSM 22645 / JCM 10191 / CCUG 17912 / NBRC 13757 / NCIMB 11200 / NRRL B-4491 / Barker I) TaxID=579138 RepID=F8ES95_ZYMMT|nr:HAD family phosphatase [Zymomonas mobilis]AEI37670.1 HAD-superfamily hydrolase, subfamily IA, variant 3 [Zymomonas mobilis subsp. pomaceae ATCC 29192]MDX5949038.1 HAD family phosphatase [Zymomonas mobilis subsp. pomaceae]GEB88843.1 phosphatase [Zymomonas mobilis subsp. pomaceae]